MAQSRTTNRLVIRGTIKALGFAGAVTTALVAPNAMAMIDMLMKQSDKKNATKTISYLKYHKLITVKEKNGQLLYRLTSKGADRFEKIMIEELTIPTPKRWDHKWRMVLFDIPVTHKKSRQKLLHKLREMNFYLLQHSAWVHPFDCEKQVGAVLQHLKLEKYVSFVVIESGNFTDHATNHFKRVDLLI